MNSKNTTKIISTFLLISIIIPAVLFSIPQKANAVWGFGDIIGASPISDSANISQSISGGATAASSATGTASTVTNTGLHFKDIARQLYQQVLMSIAQKLLQKMTSSIVSWINSGFHGTPLFLENPQSFFTDIVKSQVKTMVDRFGYDLRRFPFGKAWALNTINTYKSTSENNAAHTLSNVMTQQQIANYGNFSNSGWDGFGVNTQYPQNNYLGFQMKANEYLSQSIKTPVEKTQSLLQQGQGFLSPQKCDPAVNPDYNNGYNEFNHPRFNESSVQNPCSKEDGSGVCNNIKNKNDETSCNQCLATYATAHDAARAEWAKKNECKDKNGQSGLINTTPGTVVADQIKINLGSSVMEKQLAGALGNSLSVVFDALINKFIGDGLNALTSKINPQPVADNWSYGGQTLGSPPDTRSTWNSGPDEEVVLKDFKILLSGKTIVTKKILTQPADQTFAAPFQTTTEVQAGDTTHIPLLPNEISKVYIPDNDILRTENETKLINNLSAPCTISDLTKCGVVQLMKLIPEKMQILDQCLPGPNRNWEKRLKSEEDIAAGLLTNGPSASQNETETRALDNVKTELTAAVTSFKNWIKDRMLFSLPSAIIYMDEIKKLDAFPQQLKEVEDTRRLKAQTLARLKVIKASLDLITKQPVSTDPDFLLQENKLISLKKQYNAIKSSISSTVSTEDTLNTLNTLKDQVERLTKPTTGLIAQCQKEKTAAGTAVSAEMSTFCTVPIISGYSHGKIISAYKADNGNNLADAANASGYTFRNLPYTRDNPKPGPAPENDPGYFGDLMLVNSPYVYGNINCDGLCKMRLPSLPGVSGLPDPADLFKTDDRKGVNLSCDLIFNSSFADYTTNE